MTPTPHPADALPLPEPFMAMCRDTVPHIYDAWANQLRAAHRDGYELAMSKRADMHLLATKLATANTPSDKVRLLQELHAAIDALASQPAQEQPPTPNHSPGNMAQPIHDPAVTTPREVLVGESPVDRIAAPAQPLIVRALRECTEPHDKQQQAGSVMLTDAEKLLPHGYLFAKVAMVVPLLEEARDALTAITEHQRRLRGISPTLADRMDVAGTYSLEDWQATAGGVA